MAANLSNSLMTEASYGETIGEVSSDKTIDSVALYFDSYSSYLALDGTTLRLADDAFADYESQRIYFGDGFSIAMTDQEFYLTLTYSDTTTEDLTFSLSATDVDETLSLVAVDFSASYYGEKVANIKGLNDASLSAELNSDSSPFAITNNAVYLDSDWHYEAQDNTIKNSAGGYYDAASWSSLTLSVDTWISDAADASYNFVSDLFTLMAANSQQANLTALSLQAVNDREFGAALVEIGGDENSGYIYKLRDSSDVFEISGDRLKLLDNYYLDSNYDILTTGSQYYNLAQFASANIAFEMLDAQTNNIIASSYISGATLASVFADANITKSTDSYVHAKANESQNYTAERVDEYQTVIGQTSWVVPADKVITYSFLGIDALDSGDNDEFDGLMATNDAFKDAVQAAFESISNYIDITFQEVDELGSVVGDLRLGIVDPDYSTSSLGIEANAYASPPAQVPESGTIFFLGDDSDANGATDFLEATRLQAGEYDYGTIIHEIGHALGLKHPFEALDEEDESEGSENILSVTKDFTHYSVMSYTQYYDRETEIAYEGANADAKTLMKYDILALQDMYGVSATAGAGDSVYAFSDEDLPYQAIFDVLGNDTLDLANISSELMLDLSGDRMSSIKGEHIWVYTQGDEQDYIDSPFWIIAGSLIEKITLNGGQATVYDSAYDEYFEATSSATKAITISQGNDAIKISGSSDDTITLANVDIFWSDAVSAEFSGNAGTGNMDLELTDLTSYLHHTLAVDAGDGQDQLIGTAGNDALFLQDLVVDPNSFWDGDLTANRIISVETITLNAGNDFLDMTSHTSSLTGQQIAISAGDGNDILWLSDADDTVTLGDGNDICIPSLGANNVTLGAGADTIILSAITGSCTLADFNLAEDSISFYGAATTSILDNILTFSGDDFAYEIEFSDISPSIDTIQIDFI